jgi:hypothetical protein
MAQLAERLRLDLADALAGHVELAADLIGRPGAALLPAESASWARSLLVALRRAGGDRPGASGATDG